MPIYKYLALDSEGKEQTGNVEAADFRQVASQLRGNGLRVLKVEDLLGGTNGEAAPEAMSWRGIFPIKLQDKVFFFNQLALMLRSGLTILQSLEVTLRLTKHPRLKNVVEEMMGFIKDGGSFSHAMEVHDDIFPQIAIQLIRSAEASGELDVVLVRIAENQEQKADTRRNLITAMVYPTLVIVASFGVAGYLLVNVVPKFKEFFERSGKPMPPLMQLLVDMSNNFIIALPYIAVFLIFAVTVFSYTYKLKQGRLAIDRFLLSVPLIGSLITRAAMAQVSWALSMLLKSGVTLMESLRVSRDLVGNVALQSAFDAAGEKVLNGKDLATSLQHPKIPDLLSDLAAVGEKSGSLEQVMKELGAHYDMSLSVSIKRMSNMIEPIMICVIGSMVGFVYFAFFQAIMSLTG